MPKNTKPSPTHFSVCTRRCNFKKSSRIMTSKRKPTRKAVNCSRRIPIWPPTLFDIGFAYARLATHAPAGTPLEQGGGQPAEPSDAVQGPVEHLLLG